MGRRASPATLLLASALILSATVAEADNVDGELKAIYEQMMHGRYRESITAASSLLQKHPDAWKARLFRAEAYEKLGKRSLAKEDQDLLSDFKVVTRAPDEGLRQAMTCLKEENYPQAVSGFSKYLKQHPRDTGILLDRARAYRGIKQFDKALADYNRLLKLDPMRTKAIRERAKTFVELHRNAEALDDLARFIDLHPAYDGGFAERAELYLKMGRLKDAIADYTSILSFQPQDDETLRFRAEAYLADGESQKALDDFTRLLQFDPLEPGRVYMNRAQAYDKLGKHNLADADRRKAKELGYQGQK